MGFEVEDDVGSPCNCGVGVCDTRCTDCSPTMLTCSDCFVRKHQTHPFHWAQVWNSKYFQKVGFSSLGGVLHLGHAGTPCESSRTRKMIITHVNGVHETTVSFCACNGANEQWVQLLRRRLFPATFVCPESAFTVDLLKLAHLITLNCHTSVHAMSTVLRRLTNDPHIHRVPVSLVAIFQCSFSHIPTFIRRSTMISG